MGGTIDAHCDSILKLEHDLYQFFSRTKELACSWPGLLQGQVELQFMACFIESCYKPEGALSRGLILVEKVWQLLELSQGRLRPILKADDLKLIDVEHPGLLISIEGGEVLEDKVELVDTFYRLGVRSITLTWNQKNLLASGTWDWDANGGLTPLGNQVVKRMNELGMLVDISHMTPRSAQETIAASNQPVVASHSCCSTLCGHRRNLEDEAMKALAKKGGVICLTLAPDFLAEQGAGISHVVDQYLHALNIVGEDHVGFGSDFDGIDTLPNGIEGSQDVQKIWSALQEKGVSPRILDKIRSGNLTRVLTTVLK